MTDQLHKGATLAILASIALVVACLAGCSRGAQPPSTAEAPAPPPQPSAPTQQTTVITVFSPCAFAKAAVEIGKLFEQQNPGVKVNCVVENVGVLQPRIERGEKPEAFLGVGDHEVKTLESKGLVEYAQDFCFTSLALVVPASNPAGIKTLADLAKPQVKTIAIADDARSAGYYARQLLEEKGLWDKVQKKLVRPRFPVELLKLAAQGKVQATIAYGTCFRSGEQEKKELTGKIKLISDFQADFCQTIPCRAAVIKGAAHADLGRKFVDFLTTEEAQKILAKAGFMTLSEPKCFPPEGKSEGKEPA
ncbi:MAG: molybdate ABC transporter substrate-binding protein [Armatimonadetes bacterium]|nr:molybdate ABC transporter substrate-binding protein [Armatimonadota bacterium]